MKSRFKKCDNFHFGHFRC